MDYMSQEEFIDAVYDMWKDARKATKQDELSKEDKEFAYALSMMCKKFLWEK